jgi:molybdenum cofactor cytidylyltransferase
MGHIAAIVLAAGASSRMGEHKLLLRLGNESLVRRTVRQVVEAGFDPVVVVLGRDPESVKQQIEDLGCEFVHNPDYLQGIGASFRAGLGLLDKSVEAALITLADMPLVSTEMYRELSAAYHQTKPLIVSGLYGEVRAPPHIFRRELFAVLGTPGNGAVPLVERHLDQAVILNWPGESLFDIDEPADYERARELIEKG